MNLKIEFIKNKPEEKEGYQNTCFQVNKFTRNTNSRTIIDSYEKFDRGELERKQIIVSIAGRILGKKNFGKLLFADIVDESGVIQLMFEKKDQFSEMFKELNIGDIIGVEGNLCKTKVGTLTVKVYKATFLSKCEKSLPDSKYYGFKDIEERFRKRYLDLIINRERKNILIKRSKIVGGIREFLDQQQFIEIETPILVSAASGAQAKPFVTHHNKLQKNFYLRIATEIPLKMLLIGGFEKIYEIGRVFRNEGIDARHNPEFTTIEVYQAYEDMEYMMNLTERMFSFLAQKLFAGKTKFSFNSQEINLNTSFTKISMIEAIKKYLDIDFLKLKNFEQAQNLAQIHGLKLESYQNTLGHIIYAFFNQFVEKQLINPTFVYDFPLEVSPLAKASSKNSQFAERFEVYIAGLEFANGYSELNDPKEQKRRFAEQNKQKELGNEEIASYDQEFIEALEHGMPPAAGLGIGIDRLVMLLTEQDNIKEVVAFPQLKSKDNK